MTGIMTTCCNGAACTTDEASGKRDNAPAARSVATYIPAMDVTESPDAFIATLNVPGVSPDSVAINLEHGVLHVTATVLPRGPKSVDGFLHREYGVGDYVRTFYVGDNIDQTRIEAAYAAGVLTVTLPKAKNSLARKIEIRPVA